METADAGTTTVTFASFVAESWPRLLRTAHLLTGDPDDGAELLQDVLAKLFPRWDALVVLDHPEAYVRAAVFNAYLDQQRKRRRRLAKEHVLRVRSEPAESRDPDVRLDLWQVLGTLSARERAVVVLRYYEDLRESEIAEVLGVSQGSVKSYAHAALRKLRERVAPPTTPPREADPDA